MGCPDALYSGDALAHPATSPFSVAHDASGDAGHAASGFQTIDELARAPGAAGFHVAAGPAEVLDALARHIERRAVAAARPVVRVGAADDAWREIAARLGVVASPDPLAAAAAILGAARRAVVIAVDPRPSQWGRAVGAELERLASERGATHALFFHLVDPAASAAIAARPACGGSAIAVEPTASRADARLFWDAVARDADRQLPRIERLDALDGWWSAARATPLDARPAPPALSEPARALLARLALSRRSLRVDDALRLGTRAALDELHAAAAVEVDACGRVASSTASSGALTEPDATTAEREHALAVARLLDSDEPWSAARASELYALAGEASLAEAAATRAIAAVSDAEARGDFWKRWEATLASLPAEHATARLLRCADLALEVGDVDRGLSFAHAAAARGGDGYETMLALGRATSARGDLTTAAIALGKAMDRAPSAGQRARAQVEMAELRYIAGDLDEARRHAESALEAAGDLATRLLARNVLGKLYLAGSAWAEAEEHFAADACEAACGGDVVGELRARLNRAIALLSSGRRDEARSMLTAVLEDGDRRGELRATAMAIANLATIATLRQEYAEALGLWVRAIDALRRMGDKIRLARVITNLAELRLQVGLVAEAEQALVFGRQACGPGMPAARFSHFAFVAARIHLARGRTAEAAAEVSAAIAGAASSSDGRKLGECWRVAALIALEDGDLARADAAIAKAREEATAADARAEIALLVAMRARAAGEELTEPSHEALELAREADDLELARDAHVLLVHAARASGDERAARTHLDAALAIRERTAAALPDDIRKRFLARRDLADLARLEAEAATWGQEARLVPSSGRGPLPGGGASEPRNSQPPPSLRRLVGEDPAMAALTHAIRKVGQSDATVLVHGESGTGKELVAEAIHEASPRRGGPLVKVNCAALVETLLLSELFGHEKGSFTGAAARRRGRFEMAEGGTIFLDEIGDISPRTQVALLRVLQEKTFERVGGVTPIRANVRIVCATHRDLKAMVARGEFREDLYYRLRGLVLEVPALRQRLGDLPLIAAAILARIGAERGVAPKRLSPRALEGLSRHAWPGNVRELENALRAAALFADGDAIELEDFTSNVEGLRGIESVEAPPTARAGGPPRLPGELGTRYASEPPPSVPPSIHAPESSSNPTEVAYAHVRGGVSLFDMKRQIERDCIARALTESNGNITRAATLLGMKRPRLSQLVKQYGLGSGSEEG